MFSTLQSRLNKAVSASRDGFASLQGSSVLGFRGSSANSAISTPALAGSQRPSSSDILESVADPVDPDLMTPLSAVEAQEKGPLVPVPSGLYNSTGSAILAGATALSSNLLKELQQSLRIVTEERDAAVSRIQDLTSSGAAAVLAPLVSPSETPNVTSSKTNNVSSGYFEVLENGSELSLEEASIVVQMEQLKMELQATAERSLILEISLSASESALRVKTAELEKVEEEIVALRTTAESAHQIVKSESPSSAAEPRAVLSVTANPKNPSDEEHSREENAMLKKQVEDLQRRLDSAVLAARKAGEAAASKVLEMQGLLRESFAKAEGAEANAANAKLVADEKDSQLNAAQASLKSLQEALQLANEAVAEGEKRVVEADLSKAEAISKMDKAYSVIRKSKQELENKTKELETTRAALQELSNNMEEAERNWQEKLRLLEDDLANKTSEAKALESTLSLIKLQMRSVAIERDASVEELHSLRREIGSTAGSVVTSPRMGHLQLEDVNAADVPLPPSPVREVFDDHHTLVAPFETPEVSIEPKLANAEISEDVTKLHLLLQRENDRAASFQANLSEVRIQLETSAKELKSAKEALSSQTRVLSMRDDTIEELRKQVAEEEEKKNKSIQLLRSTKARILKLEETVRLRDIDLATLVREAEFEQRISNLDAELETSKRLFESKSIEADALKLKLSDLERAMYETEVSVGAHVGDLESLRREVDRLRRELASATHTVAMRDATLADTSRQLKDANETLVSNEREATSLAEEVTALKTRMAEIDEQLKAEREKLQLDEVAWRQRVAVAEREKEITSGKLLEKDQRFEESRLREAQLAKINKALKDEVRRLSRAAGLPTPITTPPLTSRPSVVDENDVQAAAFAPSSARVAPI
ncbi:hypothetical protein HK405_014478, partial [Cladochytrium tenue]